MRVRLVHSYEEAHWCWGEMPSAEKLEVLGASLRLVNRIAPNEVSLGGDVDSALLRQHTRPQQSRGLTYR